MQDAKTGKFQIFDASSYRVGIVIGQFNCDLTHPMLAKAHELLDAYKVPTDNRDEFEVAGSIEIPVVLKKLAESKKYSCLVAIGAVIKGETPHFNYVCKIATGGVLQVMMDYGIPIGFGIITTNNRTQAEARLNAGADAALAALHVAKNIEELKRL